VEDTFWTEDAAIILNIPTYENVPDWPVWHFDSKGIFSVRSAYKLVVQLWDEGGVVYFQLDQPTNLLCSCEMKEVFWLSNGIRFGSYHIQIKSRCSFGGLHTTIYQWKGT
jgi:hypothetical protein